MTDKVTIGGINFNSDDIIAQSSKRMPNAKYNGKPISIHTVETKHGTYQYYDQHTAGSEIPAISFDGNKVNISNCSLNTLTGTSSSDTYVLNNSSLFGADIKDGKSDYIVLQGTSNLRNVYSDSNDTVLDLRDNEWTPLQ